MKMLIVINGYPKSGKSLMCEYINEILLEKGILSLEVSYASLAKSIAIELGWNGQKTSESRLFLSELTSITAKWKNLPFKKNIEEINNGFDNKYDCAMIHAREPQTIMDIKEYYKNKDDVKVYTVYLEREVVKNEIQSNTADKGVKNYNYDFYFYNNGNKEHLFTIAKDFVELILSRRTVK